MTQHDPQSVQGVETTEPQLDELVAAAIEGCETESQHDRLCDACALDLAKHAYQLGRSAVLDGAEIEKLKAAEQQQLAACYGLPYDMKGQRIHSAAIAAYDQVLALVDRLVSPPTGEIAHSSEIADDPAHFAGYWQRIDGVSLPVAGQ